MNNHAEFYDIFDYYTPPFYQTTVGKAVIAASIIATLAVMGYLFILYRKKKALTPWEWAHKELGVLVVEKCTCKDDYKKLYFQMSSILKQYLHKRYAWATEDKTDDELIPYLARQKFDAKLLEMLRNLTDGAQWIKFANEDVLRNQAERDHTTARLIVKQTTPKEHQPGAKHV